MKEATDQIYKELEHKINSISNQETDILLRAGKCIEAIHAYIAVLKKLILENGFKDQGEEIFFFKNVKPKFVSQLIYYHHTLRIESNKPVSGNKALKKYLKKELSFLKMYHFENKDFYKYYQTDRTYLDDKYFKRQANDIDIFTETLIYDRDPNFSTSHDHKVSQIIAFKKLEKYLKRALLEIESSTYNSKSGIKNKLTWTGSKIALIELLYAFQSAGTFNNSNADVRQIATYFESVFNVEIGNYYRAFQEIRSRKGIRTRFLDQMREKLVMRMDETDEGGE